MNRARISDLALRLEMSQKQLSEKTQQLEQKRHQFESKSADLEDLKVKIPQSRRKLEFEIETSQKSIWERLQTLYKDFHLTKAEIKEFKLLLTEAITAKKEICPDRIDNDGGSEENSREIIVEMAKIMKDYHKVST